MIFFDFARGAVSRAFHRKAALVLSCACFAFAFAPLAAQGGAGSPALPASIPASLAEKINADRKNFDAGLETLLSGDRDGLLILVDKKHALPDGFVPSDLVPLKQGRPYVAGRKGLELRAPAEAALAKLAVAARADGVTLVASSAYRSYAYQKTVYSRIVGELGQAAADRESARPGMSQHQTGTAVDFGSITDEFAETKAGKWLAANAWKYGWSLSFPKGGESVTGYRWECWHYRYVGVEAAAFQRKWFGDVQQYMIECVDAYRSAR
jgi:D-alanyl-D-alanine carboxypeptidase